MRHARRSLTLAVALALSSGVLEAATVTGRVTDATGNAAFAGAQVRLVELGRQAVSGNDGRFRLNDVPDGSYTLEIDYLGAERTRHRIDVSGDVLALGDLGIGDDVGQLDNVLVIGQLAGQAAALNRQRTASTIGNVIAADAIGQFPDQNVAESLQRIPGLSLARDQGEGRFAVIRGIDPSLNTTTINGVRIPGPEDDSRQVNLDVISSDLLETLEVSKSVTPDMDGDAVGGNIEIRSLSAFDRGPRSVSGRIEGSYNELRSELNPKAALTYTQQMSLGDGRDNFGVALSLSHYQRKLGSDGIEPAGFPLLEGPDGEVPGIEEAEQRDYTLTRERTSASLNFDWRVSESTQLYWRTLFSSFEDDEVQLTNVFKFEDGDIDSLTPDSAQFSGAAVEKLTEARVETQEIFATSLGGISYLDRWTVDYNVSHAFANEDQPNALGGLWVAEGVDLAYDLASPRRPRLIGLGDALTNAGSYALDEAELESAFTEERENAFAVNLQRDFDTDRFSGFFKFGGKARLREKEADIDLTVFEGFGDDFSLADFAFARTEYPFGEPGPFASRRSFADFFRAGRSSFEIDQVATDIENAGSDYGLDEDVYAAYAMAQLDFGQISFIGGLRYEDTRYRATGTRIVIDEETGDGDPQIEPVIASKDYDHWLPGLHMRWELGEDTLLRAAATRTIGRPSFEASAPRQLIEIEEDDGEFERQAEVGNPDLDPLTSNNLDLMLEYYTGGVGLLSAGVFYKDIRDFVVFVDVAGTDAFVDFDEAIQPVNGGDAELFGIELGWVRQLDFLPGVWDGLLVAANYTYVDSEAEVPFRATPIPLPLQSDQIANLALGYEKHGLTLRLAATWRSEYFEEVNEPDDPLFDRYADDHLQLDFTAKYRVNPNLQVYFNAINLNDEPFYAYFGKRRFASQFEQYGRTYELGLQFNY